MNIILSEGLSLEKLYLPSLLLSTISLTLLVSDLWFKQYHRVRYPELPGDLEGPVQTRLTL